MHFIFLVLSLFTFDADIKQTPEPPVIKKLDIIPPAKKLDFDKKKDITGIFRVTGKGTDGNSYSGTTTISQPSGTQIYIIRQLIGKDLSTGIGILLDNGNRLVVSWKQADNVGVTIVDFNGKSATTRWASLQGDGRILREIWTYLGSMEDD